MFDLGYFVLLYCRVLSWLEWLGWLKLDGIELDGLEGRGRREEESDFVST